MNITLKHLGELENGAYNIIDLNIDCDSAGISQEITNFDGSVDESLIEQLKQVVSELEQQNELIKNS